jgi:hypothetical protein
LRLVYLIDSIFYFLLTAVHNLFYFILAMVDPPEGGAGTKLTAEDLAIIDEFLTSPAVPSVEVGCMSIPAPPVASDVGARVPMVPTILRLKRQQRRWASYVCPEPGCGAEYRKVDAFERHKADHISGVSRRQRRVGKFRFIVV